jgi:hypothetical protein
MRKNKGDKAIDMSERDFLAAMHEEEMPAQDCVSAIYEHYEKMRDYLPATGKAALTKRMKFYQRVGKIDPKALPMLLALDPEYNTALNQYL